MLQVVRRKPSTTTSATPYITRKARRLEIAFVTLAAANLFVLSSALSFYMLVHKG